MGVLPAVAQFGPDVFEICVPHVVDAEDVDVGVLRDAFLDVGVEADGQFFALFVRFGKVHHSCALGFGHFGGFAGGVWRCDVWFEVGLGMELF